MLHKARFLFTFWAETNNNNKKKDKLTPYHACNISHIKDHTLQMLHVSPTPITIYTLTLKEWRIEMCLFTILSMETFS